MTPKPLLSLTAADLMSRPPVVIPEGMSLQAAAHVLSQAQVSGAPVVDAEGRCVGVISATDFVLVVDEGQEPPAGGVGGHMTADPVMVSPTAPLGDLAQHMLDAHIHRVVVVDEGGRPLGVVSSTDILAAVAQAARVRLGKTPHPGVGFRPEHEPIRG